MKKTFVLDANVLLHDSQSIHAFKDNDVVIILAVLAEVDAFKKHQGEIGVNAREVARELDRLSKIGNLSNGVDIGDGGKLFVYTHHSFQVSTDIKNNVDGMIISETGYLRSQGHNAIIVSKDIMLRVIATTSEIPAEDYETDSKHNEIYTGIAKIVVDQDFLNRFAKEGEIFVDDQEFYPNQYVHMVSEIDEKKSLLGRANADGKIVIIHNKGNNMLNIKPRNMEQIFASNALMDDNIKLVTLQGMAGTGKAQPIDALVLTPTGYKKMGDIKIGDDVISNDGKSTKVSGVFPQGFVDVYKMTFSDGSFTECCGEHLWETRTVSERNNKKSFSLKNTKQIMETLVSGSCERKNHSIPMTDPVEFSNDNVPLDPYFLGLLLGDGYMRTYISLSTSDQEIVDYMTTYLNSLEMRLTHKHKKDKCCYDYDIVNKKGKPSGLTEIIAKNMNGEDVFKFDNMHKAVDAGFSKHCIRRRLLNGKLYENMYWTKGESNESRNYVKNELIKMGVFGCLSYEKFVPEIYKFSNKNIRLSILQGLLDTDGTVAKKSGCASFCTTSKRLSDDVKFLVESLGGVCSVCEKIKKFKYNGEMKIGRLCYNMHISLRNDIVPFRLKRKLDLIIPKTKYFPIRYITNVEYVGKKECQCIYVDNESHLYLTNNFIVTHNTLISVAAAISKILDDTYSKLVITRPVIPVGKDLGFLPGNLEEKMGPWMQPIFDAIDMIKETDRKSAKTMLSSKFSEDGVINIAPLTYLRGRSIPHSFMLIDESQNISPQEVKTIVTRCGEGTKMVFTGDVDQIDNPFLDRKSNGLTYLISKFKSYDIHAHVQLNKGERSRLAEIAAEIL